jgi:hypothetical protein
VLCQLRNAQVTRIEAVDKGFDDADATRIAEALRCDVLSYEFVRSHAFCVVSEHTIVRVAIVCESTTCFGMGPFFVLVCLRPTVTLCVISYPCVVDACAIVLL